jgi:hypothetical protein
VDVTEVDVELLPPLARIAITRRFSNASSQLLEAVLTLPPPAKHEVVYGLTVTINGVAYRARAQPHARAQHTHSAAIAGGRRAILHEMVADVAQLISVAGIEKGAQVAVCIESIRPLDRAHGETATLSVVLTADPRRANLRLTDADAIVTVPHSHAATLTVIGEGMRVTVKDSDCQISSGKSVPIRCAGTLSLQIDTIGDRNLDHSTCDVELPGGWEVSSGSSAEAFSHPMHPDRNVMDDRTDWMFGRMDTADREIRVTAPVPDESGDALSPNARAISAFAAAAIAGAARPYDTDAIRLAANILTRSTNLVFVGPNGELPDEIPTLRKLALPGDMASDVRSAQPPIIAPRPPENLEVAAAHEGLASTPEDRSQTSGAPPPSYFWLNWAPAILFLLWVLGALQYLSIPLAPVLGAFVVVMLLNAVRFFPRRGLVRRRMPLLALLAVPWIISILYGPLGLVELSADPAQREWMVQFQGWLLAASAILPLLLLPVMRGGRSFTIVVGILNSVATFFITSAAMITNMPGS